MNPTVRLTLAAENNVGVIGMVQDDLGHALSGVRVGLAGNDFVTTGEDGEFQFRAHAARDQAVLLHAEKKGLKPVNLYHRAGDSPAILIFKRESPPAGSR